MPPPSPPPPPPSACRWPWPEREAVLVVLTSAKGSPGATTTALVLAGVGGGVVVECDPGGGDVRCWSPSVQGEGAGLVELVHGLRTGEPDPDELVSTWADEPWP